MDSWIFMDFHAQGHLRTFGWWRETDRHRKLAKGMEKETEREREREIQRLRDSKRERERERERESWRQRQTDRESCITLLVS